MRLTLISLQPLRLICYLVLLSALLSAVGCRGREAKEAKVREFDVVNPVQLSVVAWGKYPARITPTQYAVVTARVGGVLEKAPLLEGAIVNQGDVLFQLDSRPYLAELKSREADVAKARAEVARATSDFARREKLKGTSALSASDYEQSLAILQQAKANLEATIAQQDLAQLNLSWTKVDAPITGRVGRKLVTEGNLISGGIGIPTPLTTIVSIDPIYALAVLPEKAYVKQIQRGGYMQTDRRVVPCRIQVANAQGFERWGTIDFIDNKIDPATGTVEIRCVVSNQDHKLASGLTVDLSVPRSEPYDALLVPELAIGTDQGSKFLLTVAQDGSVVRKNITLGELFGPLRAIESGVTRDDQVLISGLMQARAGDKVKPKLSPISEHDIATAKDVGTIATGIPTAIPTAPSDVTQQPTP